MNIYGICMRFTYPYSGGGGGGVALFTTKHTNIDNFCKRGRQKSKHPFEINPYLINTLTILEI